MRSGPVRLKLRLKMRESLVRMRDNEREWDKKEKRDKGECVHNMEDSIKKEKRIKDFVWNSIIEWVRTE